MQENNQDENNENPIPPGEPDRTPVKEPERKKEKPVGDPVPPEKKKPRL